MRKRSGVILMILFVANITFAREISFVGEGFNPDPNEEVTVYVQTDTPLFAMGAAIYVLGDANITGAMCEADCNQYGWDNGWNSDPYIDPNGLVVISGISWTSDANGVVGYIKFRYNSGQISVYIDQENSSANGWDSNSYSDVPFTTEVLLFGEPDPNEPNEPNEPMLPYDSGSGTMEDPYQICTVADWNEFMNTPGDWNKHFTLAEDINLQGVALTPIGNLTVKFVGTFNGNNHIIRNVYMNLSTTQYVGLFGYIDSGGQIYDLGIENANIISQNVDTGGLAGYNNGTITGCYVTGAVITAEGFAGGLVGRNDDSGVITDCYTEGSVGCYGRVGGLVGHNSGDINNSKSACVVTGHFTIGGLVGTNGEEYAYATITNCSATGTVTGDGVGSSIYIGGLAGFNYAGSSITGCYATGAVTGYSDSRGGNVGGLVGRSEGAVTNCYATGAVAGYRYIGGLVGHLSRETGYDIGAITNCYSTGSVSGTVSVGGLLGLNSDGIVSNSVWDVNTSGRTTSAAGTGKTTVQMKTLATFTAMSWDFATPVWKICEDIDYPKLEWQEPSLVGDFVCPYGVDIKDLAYFVDRWLLTDCGTSGDCDGTDIRTDGTVNFLDFAMFADNWLEGI